MAYNGAHVPLLRQLRQMAVKFQSELAEVTKAVSDALTEVAGASSLPYTIVYDQSYVGTGTWQDSIGNSRTITLHGDYDAVGVITTAKSTYPVDTEKARQCLLKELVTLESPITAFCQNYITLKGLPATSTAANKLGLPGLVVIYNRWATSDTSVSYKDRQLRLTDNTTTNNYGTYSWNNASNQYHVFGITLNSSILPVSGS